MKNEKEKKTYNEIQEGGEEKRRLKKITLIFRRELELKRIGFFFYDYGLGWNLWIRIQSTVNTKK